MEILCALFDIHTHIHLWQTGIQFHVVGMRSCAVRFIDFGCCVLEIFLLPSSYCFLLFHSYYSWLHVLVILSYVRFFEMHCFSVFLLTGSVRLAFRTQYFVIYVMHFSFNNNILEIFRIQTRYSDKFHRTLGQKMEQSQENCN